MGFGWLGLVYWFSVIYGGSRTSSQDGAIYLRANRVHSGAHEWKEDRCSLGEIRREV